MKLSLFNPRVAAIAVLFSLAACQKNRDLPIEETSAFSAKSPHYSDDLYFYALAGGMALDKYNIADPEQMISSAMLTGLQMGETILAIDFRPATGQLYGISSAGRLYVINPDNGASRAIGNPITLNGTMAGFDFNPTVDRIRLVTSSGQNLRLHPETGAVAATDGMINGVAGAMITAAAYTSNFAGATTTTLYDIDLSTGMLYKQMPPNDGTLVAVGDIGLKLKGEGGFDISPMDFPLGLFEVNKKSTLFTVDLMTGKAKILAKYEKSLGYTGIAIATRPVAYAVSGSNLLIINPMNTSSIITKPISGLTSGEMIAGIDFRPLTGALYALTSAGRLMNINTSSGAASFIATLSVPLSGSAFGFDFNPTVDRIRIISNTGQNLRANPMDGVTITDGMLNPGSPSVTAAAYTNNYAGATSTMLFDIDTGSDKLMVQTNPNAGTLMERGMLGVDADAANGFDIGSMSGNAWAVLTSGGTTKLYSINLTTGAASAMGMLPSAVSGFAVGLGF